MSSPSVIARSVFVRGKFASSTNEAWHCCHYTLNGCLIERVQPLLFLQAPGEVSDQAALTEGIRPEALDERQIEDLIAEHLQQHLEILPEQDLANALHEFVDKVTVSPWQLYFLNKECLCSFIAANLPHIATYILWI